MTIETAAAFAIAMFLLAVSPGAGLAAILSRALGSGPRAGFAVTTGLILGDFTFIAIAMVGLSAIASAMGPMFQIVKYAGAVYLLWLGYKALRSADKPIEIAAAGKGTPLWRDVALGLFVTMGNPKPIFFYGALLPTFMDMTTIGLPDFLTLAVIVTVISFVVYGAYIYAVERSRRLMASTRAVKRLNQATGVMLIGSGIAVAAK
jgi:threonine/homoserine/homoserine lactone efflux protein